MNETFPRSRRPQGESASAKGPIPPAWPHREAERSDRTPRHGQLGRRGGKPPRGMVFQRTLRNAQYAVRFGSTRWERLGTEILLELLPASRHFPWSADCR